MELHRYEKTGTVSQRKAFSAGLEWALEYLVKQRPQIAEAWPYGLDVDMALAHVREHGALPEEGAARA